MTKDAATGWVNNKKRDDYGSIFEELRSHWSRVLHQGWKNLEQTLRIATEDFEATILHYQWRSKPGDKPSMNGVMESWKIDDGKFYVPNLANKKYFTPRCMIIHRFFDMPETFAGIHELLQGRAAYINPLRNLTGDDCGDLLLTSVSDAIFGSDQDVILRKFFAQVMQSDNAIQPFDVFLSRFPADQWDLVKYFFVGPTRRRSVTVAFSQYKKFIKWAAPFIIEHQGVKINHLAKLVECLRTAGLWVYIDSNRHMLENPGEFVLQLSHSTPGAIAVEIKKKGAQIVVVEAGVVLDTDGHPLLGMIQENDEEEFNDLTVCDTKELPDELGLDINLQFVAGDDREISRPRKMIRFAPQKCPCALTDLVEED